MPSPEALRLRCLALWAFGAGIFLWLPALAILPASFPLQLLDLWVLAGWPLALWCLPVCPPAILWIVALHLSSTLLSSAFTGATSLLALGHSALFATGALLLFAQICTRPLSRTAFLTGFGFAAIAMTVLALAQFAFGADSLDFRSNTTFRLPPHTGRAFAFFPEVSTLATHLLLAALIAFTIPHRASWIAGFGFLATLALTQSTVALLIAPPALLAAGALHGLDLRRISALGIALISVAAIFWLTFYTPRWENGAALRSGAMRLASVLGAFGPLASGDWFGAGLGQNGAVTAHAYAIASRLGLQFAQVPQGINSHLATRLFEEGLPALFLMITGGHFFLRAWHHDGLRFDAMQRSLLLLALGSLLSGGFVTGYRTIYTNWLWLAFPAGLLAAGYSPSARQITAQVRSKIPKSRRNEMSRR